MRNEKGFTLVEMLVAIAVTAIAGAIAVPNAVELLAQYQLGSAANEVAFEISRAKMQAVAQNRFVRVTIGGGGQTLCRQTATSQAGPWDPASCDSAGDRVILPNMTYAAGTGPLFGRNGLAITGGQMSVGSAVGQKIVEYNILGRTTISTS